MDGINNLLQQIPGWLKPVSISMAVISIICGGILMMYSRNSVEAGKHRIIQALIGVCIVLFAAGIVGMVADAIGG